MAAAQPCTVQRQVLLHKAKGQSCAGVRSLPVPHLWGSCHRGGWRISQRTWLCLLSRLPQESHPPSCLTKSLIHSTEVSGVDRRGLLATVRPVAPCPQSSAWGCSGQGGPGREQRWGERGQAFPVRSGAEYGPSGHPVPSPVASDAGAFPTTLTRVTWHPVCLF